MNYQILKFVLGLVEERLEALDGTGSYSQNFKKALTEFAVATKNLIKFF